MMASAAQAWWYLRKTDALNALRTRFRLPTPLLALRCAALLCEGGWLQQQRICSAGTDAAGTDAAGKRSRWEIAYVKDAGTIRHGKASGGCL